MKLIKITHYKQNAKVELGQRVLNLDHFLYPSLLGKVGEVYKLSSYGKEEERGNTFGRALFEGDFGMIGKEIVGFGSYLAIEEKYYEMEEIPKDNFLGFFFKSKKQYEKILKEVPFKEGEQYEEFISFDTERGEELFNFQSYRFESRGITFPPIFRS